MLRMFFLGLCMVMPSCYASYYELKRSSVERIYSQLQEVSSNLYFREMLVPDMVVMSEQLQEQEPLFIAEVDCYGYKRYYSLTTQKDVEDIISAILRGGGTGVVWYYLPHGRFLVAADSLPPARTPTPQKAKRWCAFL